MNETIDTTENASATSGEDFEGEASKMGWVPEDKFRGSPEKWVDAKTFVERGREVLPIVKAELRKTREELEQTRQAVQEFQALTQQAKEREVGEWKAKYEEAIRAKKDALDQGNGEAFIEAEAAQKALEANRPQPKTDVKPDPVFVQWRGENSWYGTDVEKTMEANLVGYRLAKTGLRGRELYDKVLEEMESRTEQARGTTRAGPVRGGKPANTSRGGKSYENLKPEFQKACDNMVKRLGIKKEDYVAKCDEEAFRG